MAKFTPFGEFVIDHLRSVEEVANKYLWSMTVVKTTITSHLDLFSNGYISNYDVTWNGNEVMIEVEDTDTGVRWGGHYKFHYMVNVPYMNLQAQTQNSAGTKSGNGQDNDYDRAMRGI